MTTPFSFWLYERKGKRLSKLFVARPELEGAPLVAMQDNEIKTRDGMTLVSYLSLPKGAKGPVPMVLFVHGGPWARDYYGYHSYHQWLANRGYAVLSVNFRGSTGFGKKNSSRPATCNGAARCMRTCSTPSTGPWRKA
ncbi:MAG TPA: hypothetical protein VGC21_13005 [Telluria sp.]